MRDEVKTGPLEGSSGPVGRSALLTLAPAGPRRARPTAPSAVNEQTPGSDRAALLAGQLKIPLRGLDFTTDLSA
jgi:hypothetical protein